MSRTPNISSNAQKELDKAAEQFDKFDKDIKEMTMDRMNKAPKQERELEMSSKEISKAKDHYLKPKRVIFAPPNPKTGEPEKFNEKFREEYEFSKEYVQFVAENVEMKGETIQSIWTRPFGGTPAEEWDVPVNKPVWGPRYLAEQLKRKCYHRLVMQENRTTGSDGMGTYYGTMSADTTIQRLDAHPVSTKKSVFMGASGF